MNQQQFEKNTAVIKLTPDSSVKQVLAFMKTLTHYAHDGQMYNKKPYTYHLAQVELTFLCFHNREKIAQAIELLGYSDAYSLDDMIILLQAACIGHDVIKDTWVTEEYLRKKNVPEILIGIIVAVTKVRGRTLMKYLDQVLQNPLAVFVKSADSQSNLQHSIRSGWIKGVNKYTTVLRYLHGTQDENGYELNK